MKLSKETPSSVLKRSIPEGLQKYSQANNAQNRYDRQLLMYRTGALQVVDWKQNHLNIIPVERTGPNGVNNIQGGVLFEKDSIALFANSHLFVMGTTGVVTRRKLFYPANEDVSISEDYEIRLSLNFPVSIKSDYAYVPLVNGQYDVFSFPGYYQGSTVGKFDLVSGVVEALPIHHPESSVFFGDLHWRNLFLWNGKLVVTFQYSPDVYVYDESGELIEHLKQSNFGGHVNQPFVGSSDPESLISHLNLNVAYGPVQSSENYTGFFQFCLVPSPSGNGNSRRVAVRFFDEKFSLLAEGVLPKYFSKGHYTEDNNLYVRYYQHESNETIRHYRRVSF